MIHIDRTIQCPLNEQIYQSLVQEIINQNISSHGFLPSTRKLAEELGVSRNTVNLAYGQLVAEGYVEPIEKSGYRVLPIDPGYQLTHSKKVSIEMKEKEKYLYSFSFGSIDQKFFPFRTWRSCIRKAMDQIEYEDHELLAYNLKKELSSYLYRFRGIHIDPQRIIITSGHQHSQDIIARVCQSYINTLLMEEPGYNAVCAVFKQAGYHIDPVVVRSDWYNHLPPVASLLYVTPSHQFPLGNVLPIQQRYQILDWAIKTKSFIIEDDYDSELRYYTNPIPSLFSLNQKYIIYTGTFSKLLNKDLRVGYLILPEELHIRYQNLYQYYHSSVSLLIQLTLAEFMRTGMYEKHVHKIRHQYKQQLEALQMAFKEIFGNEVEILGDKAGLHFIIEVDSILNTEELIQKAKEVGIEVFSTKHFYKSTPKEKELIIGFANVPIMSYKEICIKLYNAWH